MSVSTTVLPVAQPGARLASQLAAVVLGSLLLVASAKIQVPFWPVPMTLQTGAVLLLALLMGPRLAIAAIALYLAQGAVGLPVFAGTPLKGIGLAYMMGPTGGYMVGWLLAAAFVGWAAARWRHPAALVGACLVGVALNYAPGLLWLAQFVPTEKVLMLGAVPFLLGDLVKVGLAVALALAIRSVVRARQAA